MHRVNAGFWTVTVRGALALALSLTAIGWMAPAQASSHREAPLITGMPKVDGTDFYMFRSYEPGRENYVTLLANYIPIQAPYGGPNFFELDPDARYQINIENDGTAGDDLVFEFQFYEVFKDQQLTVGGAAVAHPLRTVNPISFANNSNDPYLYTVTVIRDGVRGAVVNALTSGIFFAKAFDNAGSKTFADYAAYANNLIYPITIPGCDAPGKVFVGQRKESFAVNLGEVFDLVNVPNPVGDRDARANVLDDANITTLALEVPIACVTDVSNVIGGRTTAWLPRTRQLVDDPSVTAPTAQSGDLVQVSRLGMPLVNEVVIGLRDKNRFNSSQPEDDVADFATYVTNPTLPEILEILFGGAGVQAPNNFPRADLVAAFVTGITGVNQLGVGEMQRLNTSIAPTAAAAQNNLGLIGGDSAGFPNGRRPGDDVVDIELRVAMGIVCHAFPGVYCDPDDAPSGMLPFTDQTLQDASQFDTVFPYLKTPIPGSPNI
jgi:hypothetical protein